MAVFLVERTSALAPAEAWRRLTDWARHEDAVPLTHVIVGMPPPTDVGTLVVTRTGVGPVGVDDPMEVVVWRPPHRCRLEKRGTVVLGWSEIEVQALGSGSRIVWREEVRVRWLPGSLDGLLGASARVVFGRAVERLLRGGA